MHNGAHYVERYLASLRDNGRSLRTVYAYRSKLKHFWLWLGTQELSERTLYDYREHLQKAGYRPRTVRVAFTAIRSYFDWLESCDGIEGLPDVKRVRLPRMDKARRATPTDAEVAGMWEAVEKMPQHTFRARFMRGRTRAVLALLLYGGLRRSELLSLTTGDLISDNGWSIRVRWGKGGQSRSVPLCDEAVAVLKEWLELRWAWAQAHDCAHDGLIPIDSRRALSHRGLSSLWADLCERAGLTGRALTPHGMRHAFATKVAELSDIPTASALLGHSSIQTTYTYLHSSPDKIQHAVQALNGWGKGPAAAATATGPVASASPRQDQEHQEHFTQRSRRSVRRPTR